MMIRSERVPDRCIDNGTFHTRYGALSFHDGEPTGESAERLAQMLTFHRAVDVYQYNAEAVAMFRFRAGLANSGVRQASQVVIWKTTLEAAENVYASNFLDLKKGPIVVEVPAGVAGMLDDMWQRPVGDVGRAGPDKGKGGKYLLLPPGDEHEDLRRRPGYFVLRSPTYGVWMLLQPIDRDPLRAVRRFGKLRIYPLAQAGDAPAVQFMNRSDGPIDTSAPRDYRYFEQLGQLVEQEPADAVSPFERFSLAQIGMHFGQRFMPDDALKALLAEAAVVGAATRTYRRARSAGRMIDGLGSGEWRRIFA
jgi:hypothetical protein